MIPPGWYPDPTGSQAVGYWDGEAWHGRALSTEPVVRPVTHHPRAWLIVMVTLWVLAVMFVMSCVRVGKEGSLPAPTTADQVA